MGHCQELVLDAVAGAESGCGSVCPGAPPAGGRGEGRAQQLLRSGWEGGRPKERGLSGVAVGSLCPLKPSGPELALVLTPLGCPHCRPPLQNN